MNELFNAYVAAMQKEVPGFISLTVVSANDGNAIAYASNSGVDNRLSSAFQVEILRQAKKAMGYVENLHNKEIDRIEIALDEQIHLLFSSGNRQFVIHLIMDAKTYNIAITKMLHSTHFKTVEQNANYQQQEEAQPVRRRLFF